MTYVVSLKQRETIRQKVVFQSRQYHGQGEKNLLKRSRHYLNCQNTILSALSLTHSVCHTIQFFIGFYHFVVSCSGTNLQKKMLLRIA